MQKLVLILALASCVLNEQTKWGVESADGVSVLTDENFAKFVKDHTFVMVKFFAPWCGHCKNMAPGYASLAKKLNADEKNEVVIAELDATVHKLMAKKYEVTGYPSMVFFYHGLPIQYKEEREEAKIEKWLSKVILKKSEEIKTVEKLKEIENAKLAALLYLPNIDTDAVARFTAVSLPFDNVKFYYTYMDEAQTLFELEPQNSMIIFRNFDEGKKVLSNSDDLSYKTMQQFYESVRLPTVIDFSQETAQDIFGKKQTTVFFFTEQEDNEDFDIFYKIAQSRKYEYVFCKSSMKTGINKKLSEYIGVNEKHEGQVRLIKFEGTDIAKFQLKQVTEDSLTTFLNDFRDNKLTKYLKSEEPLENDTNDVKTVVGDNFEKMVLDNDNYVLLEAYAPWCGHCKNLEPIYAELAKKLKHNNKLVVAKYDGSANEHPSLEIKGFPTIKFFKRGSKSKPVDFEGERDLAGFLKFLEQQMGDDWVAASEDMIDESL